VKHLAAVLAIVCGFVVALAAAPADVSGTWSTDGDVMGNAVKFTCTLKQDGEKLTGHYTGTFGEADLTGTVKGADITFGFTVDAQGTALKETYTGTVDKDTMKGKLVIEGLGEGTFTAKRQ
jgi:hypothetical protein